LKCHEIAIKPLSAFGTPLKGDTLCGHFCWQAAYDHEILNGGLDAWTARYAERPFAVFSSAYPKIRVNGCNRYALKRPNLPPTMLFPPSGDGGDRRAAMKNRKEQAQKKWITLGEDLSFSLKGAVYATDEEVLATAEWEQPHNTINRLTQTTGAGMFAPFAEKIVSFPLETTFVMFVLIDEEATDLERLCLALTRIGKFGFGRNASTGLGRFELIPSEIRERPLPISSPDGADACYSLAPCIPEKGSFADIFFSPFTRFGKHGDALANSLHPFKNPVIMADEGAVLLPKNADTFKKPYIGRPVAGVSKALSQCIVQGYAPYLPFRLEM